MAERVWARPKPGLTAHGIPRLVPREPSVDRGTYFPPEGEWCERTQYINRRIRDGSLEIFDAPPLDIPEPITPREPVGQFEVQHFGDTLKRSPFSPLVTSKSKRKTKAEPGQG